MSDVLQAFVSRGGKLLGHEYFTEPRIVVGGGDDADLLLDGEGIAAVHATVERTGKRVVIKAAAGARVVVAGEPVETARLRGFDDVLIGPYVLKFKVVMAGAGAEVPAETPPPVPPGAPVPDAPAAPDAAPAEARAATPPAAQAEAEASGAAAEGADMQAAPASSGDPATAALCHRDRATEPGGHPAVVPVGPGGGFRALQVEAMDDGFWAGDDEDDDEADIDEPPAFSLADKVHREGQGAEEVGRACVDVPPPPPGAALLDLDGRRFRMSLSDAPAPDAGVASGPVSRDGVVVTFASVALHAAVLGGAWLLLPTEEIAENLDVDRFARVQVVDPAEERKREEEEERKEPPPEEVAQPDDAKAKKPAKRDPKAPKAGEAAPKSKFAGGGGVLGALARFNTSRAGKTSVAAMVAGISGVRSAQGARGFSVASLGSGVGGKLVVGGRAGGEGMRTGTRGIDDLFAGKKRGALGDRQGGGVRGTVRKADRGQIRSAGSGTLDKAEIEKVVNQNIGQVRYCYERTLLQTPNLRGRVMVQWTIGPDGSVRSVSTESSSVTSDSLTRCILDKIKGWRFGKPTGGQVVVSYPFVFNAVGF